MGNDREGQSRARAPKGKAQRIDEAIPHAAVATPTRSRQGTAATQAVADKTKKGQVVSSPTKASPSSSKSFWRMEARLGLLLEALIQARCMPKVSYMRCISAYSVGRAGGIICTSAT